MVTYNPTKDKVYALLKDQAKSDDIIKAAFHVSICSSLQCNWYVFWFLYPILNAFLLHRLMCYCILLMHHMHGG
jgi:hypothetical protein